MSENKKLNSYDLTRNLFDFAFENPDLISTNDIALYCWLIEKNNRCGWAEKFSVTSTENMAACGFGSYPPYKKSFDKLVELDFIKVVRKSNNQYQSNVVALSKNNKALNKALDKASLNQTTKHLQTNQQTTYDINKTTNNKQLNNETTNKEGCEKKIRETITLTLPFQTDNFKNVWQNFIEFRKEIRKPLKLVSQQAQLLKLSKYNEVEASEMIMQSIANGWQGIFELKNFKNENYGKSNTERIIGRIPLSELKAFVKPRNIDKHDQS